MAQFRHKGNRLLSSYFLTYLAVLIIPIIMACIVFSESFRIIRQDIENENRSLLQQAADVLDVQMRQMNDYGAQLINNSSLTSLRSVEKPLEYPNIQHCFRVQALLPDYTSYNNYLFDYFLFFNRGRLVLNDRMAYTYEDFYQLYMHTAGADREAWEEEILSVPARNACRLARVLYLNQDEEEEKNLILYTFPFLPSVTRDGFAMLLIDQQGLAEILHAFGLGSEDIAYIESREGALLAANTPEMEPAAALQKSLLGQTDSFDMIQKKIDGRDMLISRRSSDQMGFSITIARSAPTLYARLSGVQWLIVGSLLAAALLSAWFSYLFSRRNSSLIRSLDAAHGTQLSQMSYGKAFRSLTQSMKDIQDANQTMTQAMTQHLPYLKRTFLGQLLKSDFLSEEQAETVARGIHMIEPGQPMRVVLFHFKWNPTSNNADELQLSVNCQAVIRLSAETLEKDALRTSTTESDYAVLLYGDRMEERIGRLVQLVRSNLQQEINENLFIYVGNQVTRLTDVAQSWNNANSMIYIQPSPLEVPVLYYRHSETARYEVFYPQEIQRRLINSVMNADEQSTLEVLDLLKEKNQRGDVMPSYIAQLLIDSLLTTLLQINSMAALPEERSNSVLNGVKSLMTLPTNAQLSMINTLYSSLCNAIWQVRGGKQQLMDDISAYIREHYMDTELSLASVADHFHVSESYLSYTFKAQKGTNFFTYVEHLRMDKAKELLRKTSLRINDIASQVGYASANSFCRAFKRSTGDSASSYRNGMD